MRNYSYFAKVKVHKADATELKKCSEEAFYKYNIYYDEFHNSSTLQNCLSSQQGWNRIQINYPFWNTSTLIHVRHSLKFTRILRVVSLLKYISSNLPQNIWYRYATMLRFFVYSGTRISDPITTKKRRGKNRSPDQRI